MKFSLFVHMERWDESVSHRQLFEDLTELTPVSYTHLTLPTILRV